MRVFVFNSRIMLTYQSVFELSNYLPDVLLPLYDDFKDALLGWMETIGVIRPTVGVSTGRCNVPSSFMHC